MNLRPAHLLHKYLIYTQFNAHKALMHNKLGKLSPTIRGRWLDIGAGDQPYRKFFNNTDEYLTTNTKRHYKPQELDQVEKYTTFWIEDGKSLPLPDNSLDGVACFQVLAVIDKPDDFFTEICRVLKPGGRLILTTDFLYPAWSKEDRYRHTAYSLSQLSDKSGFDIQAIESFGGFGLTCYKFYNRWMRTFPEIWKKKLTFAKTLAPFPYLLLLALLPLTSLIGMLIFLVEKNNTTTVDFTFNLLLVAHKKK
jgi:SAM-dependent methyltransferase